MMEESFSTGGKFVEPKWPRTCVHCRTDSYKNPTPAVNVLLPKLVGDFPGLLVVKRGEDPSKGMWGLPGGYMDCEDTSWEVAGAREVMEELGIEVNPMEVKLWDVRSSRDQKVLILFGLGPVIHELPLFEANEEVVARGILPFGSTMELAFPAHTEMAARYWAKCRPFIVNESNEDQIEAGNTVITA